MTEEVDLNICSAIEIPECGGMRAARSSNTVILAYLDLAQSMKTTHL